MKQIGNYVKQIVRNAIGFSVVSNGITFIFGCIMFHSFFEEIDDLQIALIAEGAYGTRDPHVVYPNIILGKIMCIFQQIVPSVRWHTVFMLLFTFIAMTLLTFILCHYHFGRYMAVVLQGGLFYELYVSLQYTKTATFITAVGVFAVLHHIVNVFNREKSIENGFDGKVRIRILTVAYLLLLYAMLLRNSAFFIGVVFSIVPCIIELVVLIRKYSVKVAVVFLIYVLPVFASMLVFSMIDRASYKADSGWNYFLEYNDYRTQMVDYRYDTLDYSSNAEVLENLNISENDAYMFVTWQFSDKAVVTKDYIKNLLELSPKRKVDIDLVKAWVQNIYDTMFTMKSAIWIFILLAIVIIVGNAFWSWDYLLVTGQLAAFMMVAFYYQYSGRWNRRLIYATLCAIIVTFAGYIITKEYSSKDNSSYMDMTYKIVLGVLFILFIGTRIGNEFEYQEYLRNRTDFKGLNNYMEENKDTLYIADTYSVNDRYKYNVFEALKEGSLDNFFVTGSWLSASPIESRVTKKYGYDDPFDALRRGDDVILIDNICPERKAMYFNEHGNKKGYSANYLDTVCGYNMYKLK